MSNSEDSQKLDELVTLIGNGSSYDALMKGLAFLGEQNIRKSELEVRWCKTLTNKHRAKLGNQLWDVYERTFLAALDAHDNVTSKDCLAKLTNQFPKSNRVSILHGMELEAKGKYSEALKEFSKTIEADPSNQLAHKRKICVMKAMGETEKASAALRTYLKTYSSDANAWGELCELYKAQGTYSLAKFCLEELLLINPENYAHHLHYAEVLYTLKQFAVARAYFAQSLELKPKNNLRALYGLIMCIRVKGGNNQMHADLFKYSAERLVGEYRNAFPDDKGLTASSILGDEPTETEGSGVPHLVGMLKTVLDVQRTLELVQ